MIEGFATAQPEQERPVVPAWLCTSAEKVADTGAKGKKHTECGAQYDSAMDYPPQFLHLSKNALRKYSTHLRQFMPIVFFPRPS